MTSLAEQTSMRLQNVLSRDKNQQTTNITAALRADLEHLLGEYLDLKNLELLLENSESGFILTIFARARSIRNFKHI
ncbi:MAG: hypothetical protein ACLRFR_02240 [Clostridia bacterium]